MANNSEIQVFGELVRAGQVWRTGSHQLGYRYTVRAVGESVVVVVSEYGAVIKVDHDGCFLPLDGPTVQLIHLEHDPETV